MTSRVLGDNLIETLKDLDNVVLTYTGSIEDDLLLDAAIEALGNQVKVVVVVLPCVSTKEVKATEVLLKKRALNYEMIDATGVESIFLNHERPCFLCHRMTMDMVKSKAEVEGFNYVIGATNFQVLSDYKLGILTLDVLDRNKTIIG